MFVFCLQFFGVFLFHKGLQACEIRAPEGSVLLNPGVDGAERLRVELVDTVPTFAVLANKVGAAQ